MSTDEVGMFLPELREVKRLAVRIEELECELTRKAEIITLLTDRLAVAQSRGDAGRD